MLIALASHNDDIRRLLERGYALQAEDGYLIVRDIPYLDENRSLQWGSIVTKLESVDRHRVAQQDHQVYFAGAAPYGLAGDLVPNLGGGPYTIPLQHNDVVVERSFSNKPPSGSFIDFYEKIEHYTTLIAGPAMELHNVKPYTFRVYDSDGPPSVFNFSDTLTSRAELGDLVQPFRQEVVALIGLGGTGSYLLDFLVKTPVAEIRAFDPDHYHVHNAFRSPGQLNEAELGKHKAEVYGARYASFRQGLMIKPWRIDASSADELQGVTFAFVCVDKGSARKEIFDLLISLGIPFIDVGMGLTRQSGGLAGMIRTTVFQPHNAAAIRDEQRAEESDAPDDEYRTNIQIAELNALNACLAVVQYKKLRGFYADTRQIYHGIVQIDDNRWFVEEAHGND